MADRCWRVHLTAFSFDTEEAAAAFLDKLTDAFMEMPEADGIAAAGHVEMVELDGESRS